MHVIRTLQVFGKCSVAISKGVTGNSTTNIARAVQLRSISFSNGLHSMERRRVSSPVNRDEERDSDSTSTTTSSSGSSSFDFFDPRRRPIPRPQDKAPHFEGQAVVNGQFKKISLSDYKDKWVVLFFYPLDFTFVCPTEITAFSDATSHFKEINCELIACSTDSQYSHLAWIKTPRNVRCYCGLGDMKIPVLSDFQKKIAAAYGVLHEEAGLAFRGLFIISPKGIIAHCAVNDLPIGRSVEETLRLVRAYQHYEKNGEVCPAGWKPGAKAIKQSEEGANEYFSNIKNSQ